MPVQPKPKPSNMKKKIVKDSFTPAQPAYISIAGETFFLSLPGEESGDPTIIEQLSDDRLKGDLAFQLLYLGGPTETVFKADEKKKLRLIFRSVFGIKSKLRFPCEDADEKLMVRSLLYRRDQLIKEIIAYDDGDSQDAHARYMRDHLEALNKLIDEQIPTSTEKCVDTEPEDPNAPAKVGNLTEARMLRLLEIFAFLLAQGHDPLSGLKDDLPAPGEILPRMAKAGAPGLRDYEDLYQTEMGASPNFGPTLRKLKKVLSTNPGDDTVNFSDNEIKEFITNLSEIEELFGLPNEGTPTERKAAILDMIKHILTPIEKELGIDSKESDATIEDIDSRQEAIVNEIKKLKKELEDCIQKEGCSGSALAAANAKVAALEADVATKDTKIKDLEGTIAVLVQKIRDAKLAERTARRAAAAASASPVVPTTPGTGVGVGTGTGVRRSTRSSSPVPGPALVAAQAEVTRLSAEVAQLTADLAARTGERDALIIERDRLTADLTTARADLATVTGERNAARTDLATASGERNAARTDLATASGERNAARTDLATVTADRDTAAANLAIAEAARATAVGTLGTVTAERDTATAERNAARTDLATVTADRDTAAANLAIAEAARATAVGTLGTVTAERDTATAERDAAAANLAIAEAARATAVGALGTVTAERDTATAERATAVANLAAMTAERDAATAARDAAIADLAARTTELEDARVTIGTSAGEIDTRQALVDHAREQVNVLERQLAGIEDALREADVRALALVNERDQARERSENLEAEMPELRRKAEEGKRRFDRITALTQQISYLEDQLTSLRTQAVTSEEARVAAEAARVAAVADADAARGQIAAANSERDDAIAAAASEALRVRNTAEEAARAADEALRNARTRGDTSANEVSRLQAEADRAAAASAAARRAQVDAEARADAAETARAAAVAAAATATEAATTAAQEAAAAAEADKVALQQRAEAAETARTEAVQAAETARTEAERLLSEKADLETRLTAAEAAGQGNEEVRAALVAAAAQQLAEVQNHLRAVEDESRAVHDRLGEAEAAAAAASRGRLGGEEVEALKSYIRTLAGTLGIDSSVEFEAVKQAITSMITNRNQRIVKLDRLLKLVWDGLKAFIARNRDNLETEIDLNDLPVDPSDSFIDSVRQKIGNLQVKQSPREDLLSPCLLNTLHFILFSQFKSEFVTFLKGLYDTIPKEDLPVINDFFLKTVMSIKAGRTVPRLLDNSAEIDRLIQPGPDSGKPVSPRIGVGSEARAEVSATATFLTNATQYTSDMIPTFEHFVGRVDFFKHKFTPDGLEVSEAKTKSMVAVTMLFLASFHGQVNSDEFKARLGEAGCEYQEPTYTESTYPGQAPAAPVVRVDSADELARRRAASAAAAPVPQPPPTLLDRIGFGVPPPTPQAPLRISTPREAPRERALSENDVDPARLAQALAQGQAAAAQRQAAAQGQAAAQQPQIRVIPTPGWKPPRGAERSTALQVNPVALGRQREDLQGPASATTGQAATNKKFQVRR